MFSKQLFLYLSFFFQLKKCPDSIFLYELRRIVNKCEMFIQISAQKLLDVNLLMYPILLPLCEFETHCTYHMIINFLFLIIY